MEKDLDSKLYNEYFEGKKEIFDLLYSKYKSKIEFFVFNIVKDYQTAEDISQDTFQETKKELIKAINELDDRYKNAIYLTQIEEISYKETAEILGETIQNTKNLVHRGKKQLKKVLISKGFHKENKIPKLLILVLCAGILISGFTFAEEIKLIIHNLTQNIFGTYNEGITTAIENDYEAEIDMEYVLSNGIKVKVDSIMLDDYNLAIVYNILVENDEYLKRLDVSKIEFNNVLIMDENNVILHAEHEGSIEKFIDFCEKNNLDKGEFYSGCSTGGQIRNILGSENNSKFIASELISSEKFPDSKILHIKFDTIYFLNSKASTFDIIYGFENTPKSQCRTVTGNWEFEINLDEINEKRNAIEYDVIDINDKDTTVTEAKLSMSNMRLELITSTKKIDFEKIQNRDLKTMNVFDMLAFNELYVETSNGEKFYEIGSEGTGFEMIESGKIRYHAIFNYTYFDRTEDITIHLRTNKKEEIIIKMKANNYDIQ